MGRPRQLAPLLIGPFGLVLAPLLAMSCGAEEAPQPPLPAGAPQGLSSQPLLGAYELRWREGREGRLPMPETLLKATPGCLWGRWLWDFGQGGGLRVYNELLCEDPTRGAGLCRAEFETQVRWQGGAFVVPAPINAKSQFVALEPRGGQWATSGGHYTSTTIRCNVNLSSLTATLTETSPGQSAARPQEVTLDIGNGERIHLVATDSEVDYGEIVLRHYGITPPAPPP